MRVALVNDNRYYTGKEDDYGHPQLSSDINDAELFKISWDSNLGKLVIIPTPPPYVDWEFEEVVVTKKT